MVKIQKITTRRKSVMIWRALIFIIIIWALRFAPGFPAYTSLRSVNALQSLTHNEKKPPSVGYFFLTRKRYALHFEFAHARGFYYIFEWDFMK